MFYFTFGQIHVHPETNEKMKDHFVKVEIEDYGKARELFVKKYGDKWAFQYSEKEFNESYFPLGEYEILTDKEYEYERRIFWWWWI